MNRTRRALLVAVVAGLALAPTAAAAAPYAPGRVLFTLQDPEITESSGMAVSGTDDGVIYTHNDSGEDTVRFFAVDRQGRTLATYGDTTGIDPSDIEDMAAGPDETGRRSLWFGDIGNNAMVPDTQLPTTPFAIPDREIAVYRFAEPTVATGSVGLTLGAGPVTTFRFRYDDMLGHDAETLLVHPITGQVFVVSKTVTGQATLYAAPRPLSTTAVNTLATVATLVFPQTGRTDSVFGPASSLATTGGAFSPTGDRLVIRTYSDAYEYPVVGTSAADVAAAVGPAGMVRRIPISLPSVVQGEAITYTRDGRSLLVTTEGRFGPVHILRGADDPEPVIPEVPKAAALPVLAALLLGATLARRARPV